MKKTYMIPVMEVVKIQTQQMLASSLTIGASGSANEAEAPGLEFLPEGF
ncbi:MAG: hypothetical protein J6O54_02310 [Prevotella sp.]|nr:hypothetical protein [Prevotella sp.]